jgi:hypothetical protein
MGSAQVFLFPDTTATSATAGRDGPGNCPLTCAKEGPS